MTQFNEGSVAIGTGPFRLKSYVRGSAIELVRNDDYWGEKSPLATVKMVPVTNAGPQPQPAADQVRPRSGKEFSLSMGGWGAAEAS